MKPVDFVWGHLEHFSVIYSFEYYILKSSYFAPEKESVQGENRTPSLCKSSRLNAVWTVIYGGFFGGRGGAI